jgi:hypothetical protein
MLPRGAGRRSLSLHLHRSPLQILAHSREAFAIGEILAAFTPEECANYFRTQATQPKIIALLVAHSNKTLAPNRKKVGMGIPR